MSVADRGGSLSVPESFYRPPGFDPLREACALIVRSDGCERDSFSDRGEVARAICGQHSEGPLVPHRVRRWRCRVGGPACLQARTAG